MAQYRLIRGRCPNRNAASEVTGKCYPTDQLMHRVMDWFVRQPPRERSSRRAPSRRCLWRRTDHAGRRHRRDRFATDAVARRRPTRTSTTATGDHADPPGSAARRTIAIAQQERSAPGPDEAASRQAVVSTSGSSWGSWTRAGNRNALHFGRFPRPAGSRCEPRRLGRASLPWNFSGTSVLARVGHHPGAQVLLRAWLAPGGTARAEPRPAAWEDIIALHRPVQGPKRPRSSSP